MNTEFRNKLFNKIKDVFENESTEEREAFLKSREDFNDQQKLGFELAKAVVERSYPKEDVATLRVFKKKYGDPCDVVAKDKCFYFAHNEDVDDEGESKETKSHFDFGLFGNLDGNEGYGSDDQDQFAHAYFREELKSKGCNPDIIPQQFGKDSNPYKTKHVDMCNKELGKSTSGYSQNDISIEWLKISTHHSMLMSLELLIADQEQSPVLKKNTICLNNGEWQKQMLYLNIQRGCQV